MKEFVVGSPYTTETVVDENDEFLIVACDGVSPGISGTDNSSGTCATIRPLSTLSEVYKIHRKPLNAYSNMP